jgi:hypothetical protein
LRYANDKYSQVGQDGIISELLSRLDIKRGTFVEFGAWDGHHLSNCRKLVEEGFSGVFIEGNEQRFNSLKLNYPQEEIVKINAFVGATLKSDSELPLHQLLQGFVSEDFIKNLDLLVIDVDGLDLEIAVSGGVKAKLIVLEGGFNFAPMIDLPFSNAQMNLQHPLGYIVSEMKKIGYTPICFLQDLYLIRSDLKSQVFLGEEKNSQQLFLEGFSTLSKRKRRALMLKRLQSVEICRFELNNLPHFSPDPLNFVSQRD